MTSVYLKSGILGFALGATLFAIAPLGLGIYFIELLKPVLAPGLILTQIVLGNSVGASSLALAVVLNGIIFTLPFLSYFLIRARAERQ